MRQINSFLQIMQYSPIAFVEIKPIQKIQVATRISIQVIQYDLFKSAKCQVNLYDPQGLSIHDQVVHIEGEDYNQWINDEDLIQIVIRKMNLRPLVEPEKKEEETKQVIEEPPKRNEESQPQQVPVSEQEDSMITDAA